MLIGTAVVGATTLIFAIMEQQQSLGPVMARERLSLMNAPFPHGLVAGGTMIYRLSGVSCEVVVAGVYRAVAFITANITLDGAWG